MTENTSGSSSAAVQAVEPLKLGMLGLGFSHPFAFARLLRDNALQPAPGKPEAWRQARFAYIWDDNREAAEAFGAEFGATVASSPDEILHGGVDAVLIEVHNGDRAEYATPFLRAGIPTFIDKPLCTSPEDVRLILDTARQHNTPLFSTSSVRYHPAVPAIRQAIQDGTLGTLLALRATTSHSVGNYMKEPGIWQDDIRQGGGTIVNMGIHGMEPLVAILGPNLESLSCVSGKRHFTATRSEDTALVTLHWKDGVMATLEIYSGSSAGGQTFSACGSAAILDVTDKAVRRWRGDEQESLPAGRGYAPMLEALMDMARTRQIPVPLEETEAVVLGLLAARRAAAEGRAVRLDELR